MAEKSRDPITLRLSREEKDVLDALVYLLSKTTGATKSPNDLLGPVVVEYLRSHANDPGVQLSIDAANEARRAAGGNGTRSATGSRTPPERTEPATRAESERS